MSKNTAKGSRNFYGEYSLEQWIKLILTKEIILPDAPLSGQKKM